MIGLYYRIWADCIKRGKSRPENKDNWQVVSMIFMSMAMTLNLALLLILLQEYIFEDFFYLIIIQSIPEVLSDAISFVVLFIFPCFLINYLLIFKNKKYEKLIEKYPFYEGRLFLAYFSISVFLPVILMWIVILRG